MEYTNEKHTAQSGFLKYDPLVIVIDVAKRILVIILAAIIAGVSGFIWAQSKYEPIYRTDITMVVTARGSSTTVYSNLSSTTNLAGVFTELLNSSVLRKNILSEIGADAFDGTINASAVPETNLVNISVTASDPRTTFLVANAIIRHHETVTYQVLDNISLEVLKAPTVPTAPRNSADAEGTMKKFALLAAVACTALVAFMSFSRNAVRSSHEAREKLDCRCLGELPHEKKYKTLGSALRRKKTSVLVSSPLTSFGFVENVNKLRRRVEQQMGESKVLMVTSLLENEGKSTVAVNLALALAQKHERVLLIDADLRKPACHRILDRKDVSCGLDDILSGKANLSDAIIRDRERNLFLILDKTGINRPGELIDSPRMQALLNWARTEFDYIILDLPPVSAAPDAEAMTQLCDASIMVVRQNTAVAPAINKAIGSLEKGKAKLLGCVMNNVWATAVFSGGGHGYGYGRYGKYGHYGYYGRSRSKE